MKITLQFLLIIISIFLVSCDNNEEKYPQSVDYSPNYSYPRSVYNLIKDDIDKDNEYEFIYLTVVKDANDTSNNFYNFDLIDIFDWNGIENKYNNILSDSVYFGYDIKFSDINKDNIKEILLRTNSGGLDSANSIGLKIYQTAGKHSISKIFDSEIGNPEIIDIDNDSISEVLLYRTIYNKFSELPNLTYISEIEKYYNNRYINLITGYQPFIQTKITFDSMNYVKCKRDHFNQKKGTADLLYYSFLGTFLGKNLLGSKIDNISYWNSEKRFLSATLNSNLYIDLLLNINNDEMEVQSEIDSVLKILSDSAIYLFKSKKYEISKKVFLKVLDLEPEFTEAYIYLGDVFYTQNNYNESINYYLQTFLFNRDDKRAYLGLGKNYEKLRDFKQAKIYFQRFLQYDSTSNDALNVKNILKTKEMN